MNKLAAELRNQLLAQLRDCRYGNLGHRHPYRTVMPYKPNYSLGYYYKRMALR